MFLIVFLFYLFYLSKLQRTAVEQKSCLFYLKMVSITFISVYCKLYIINELKLSRTPML